MTSIPATSLNRSLAQALQSSDNQLLESCFMESDQWTIENTVRRLPIELVLPLLNACTTRLANKGTGTGADAKGAGGGSEAVRAVRLLKWMRAVLAMHMTYLLTLPDVVNRLANLHATLTERSALHDRLLAMRGRMDVISAMSDAAAANLNASASGRERERDGHGNQDTTVTMAS